MRGGACSRDRRRISVRTIRKLNRKFEKLYSTVHAPTAASWGVPRRPTMAASMAVITGSSRVVSRAGSANFAISLSKEVLKITDRNDTMGRGALSFAEDDLVVGVDGVYGTAFPDDDDLGTSAGSVDATPTSLNADCASSDASAATTRRSCCLRVDRRRSRPNERGCLLPRNGPPWTALQRDNDCILCTERGCGRQRVGWKHVRDDDARKFKNSVRRTLRARSNRDVQRQCVHELLSNKRNK